MGPVRRGGSWIWGEECGAGSRTPVGVGRRLVSQQGHPSLLKVGRGPYPRVEQSGALATPFLRCRPRGFLPSPAVAAHHWLWGLVRAERTQPCGELSFQSLSPGSCQAGRGHLGPPRGRLSHVPTRWLWAPLTPRPPVFRPLSFRVTCYMDGMTWRLQVALCSGLPPSPEPAFLPGSHGTCSRLLINGEGRGVF